MVVAAVVDGCGTRVVGEGVDVGDVVDDVAEDEVVVGGVAEAGGVVAGEDEGGKQHSQKPEQART